MSVYKLYHGTDSNTFDINDRNVWLASDVNYAKIWGENIFEVNIKLNNVFDTFSDLGKKKLTSKQLIKYLKRKNIDTEDLEYALRGYLDSTDKYNFWECISKFKTLEYNWLANDIFHSGYDAIRIFEYGYSHYQKGDTYLINYPTKKIISINLMNKGIKEIIREEIEKLNKCNFFNLNTTGMGYYDGVIREDGSQYKHPSATTDISKENPIKYVLKYVTKEGYGKLIYPVPLYNDQVIQNEKVSKIMDDMQKGIKYHTPMVDLVDRYNFQEGRHRVIAANNLGCELIPVYVFGTEEKLINI